MLVPTVHSLLPAAYLPLLDTPSFRLTFFIP